MGYNVLPINSTTIRLTLTNVTSPYTQIHRPPRQPPRRQPAVQMVVLWCHVARHVHGSRVMVSRTELMITGLDASPRLPPEGGAPWPPTMTGTRPDQTTPDQTKPHYTNQTRLEHSTPNRSITPHRLRLLSFVLVLELAPRTRPHTRRTR